MSTRTTAIVLACLIVANVLILAGPSKLLARRGSAFDQLDLLVDVRHEIVDEYVEEPDQDKMVTAAVRGMIDALGDPYTVYLAPDELEQFDKAVRGTFSGIGAEIAIDENRLKIVSPLEDSPAWKAGVMAGDIVLEIDGKNTEGIKITDAVKQLTGEEGTSVTIKVRHESGEERAITITRSRIEIQTVRGIRRDGEQHWEFMLDPQHKIGYVRITQFSEKTADEMRAALDKLLDQGVAGLIMDLRFNGGGLLESAARISDMFLDNGKRIVSIKGRHVAERVIKAHNDGTIPQIPMVVLGNEASASASEIVAGALSDNARAKFVGTRTFGKGSVQQVKMLESGQGAIKITNAYYYLPNGRNIHRREGNDQWGVDPDDGFYVPMNTDQIRKMLDARRQGEIIRNQPQPNGQAATVTPESIEQDLADLQLAAGLKAVLGKMATGQWPKVGKSGASELAKLTKRQSLIRQRDLLKDRLDEVEKDLATLDEAPADDAKQSKTPGDAAAADKAPKTPAPKDDKAPAPKP